MEDCGQEVMESPKLTHGRTVILFQRSQTRCVRSANDTYKHDSRQSTGARANGRARRVQFEIEQSRSVSGRGGP